MTQKKQLARLFSTNPPPDDTLLESLFYNRATELELAQAILSEDDGFPEVQAVHGPTQVGKSHFVRLLLLRIKQATDCVVVQVNANNRGTTKAVLEEIFAGLYRELQGLSKADVPDGLHAVFDDNVAFFARIEPLILHEATDLEHSFTGDQSLTMKASGSVAPHGFGLSAEREVKASTQHLTRWLQVGASVTDLVEWTRLLSDVLVQLMPSRKIFVFVDDLDLLHRPGESPGEAADCAKALRSIADVKRLVVLTTVRTAWFNGREKDFSDFQQLRAFSFSDLRAIQALHITELNAGEPIFSTDALALLDKGAEGRVGIFLSLCNRHWKRFAGRPAGTLIEADDVYTYADEQLDMLRRDSAHYTLIQTIEEAVMSNTLEVHFDEDISDTGLIFRVLTPVHGRAGGYSVNPLYVEAIQRREASSS